MAFLSSGGGARRIANNEGTPSHRLGVWPGEPREGTGLSPTVGGWRSAAAVGGRPLFAWRRRRMLYPAQPLAPASRRVRYQHGWSAAPTTQVKTVGGGDHQEDKVEGTEGIRPTRLAPPRVENTVSRRREAGVPIDVLFRRDDGIGRRVESCPSVG